MENRITITETERLILRRYKQEDAQDLFEYLSDKEVVKYEPYKPMIFDETKANLEWRIKVCVRILDVGCGSGMSTLVLRKRMVKFCFRLKEYSYMV